MRALVRSLQLGCFSLLMAACASESDNPLSPQGVNPVVGGGDCTYPFVVDGAPPLDTDHWDVYNLGRTIPVKIRLTPCPGSGADVNSLAPTLALELLDPDGAPVEVIVSSSEADQGITLRHAGNGQYIFNLSTKLSRIDANRELEPGPYRLTVSSPGQFVDVVFQFSLR